MTGYTVRSLPVEERPRERLLAHGPEVLGTSELLAILLGSGMRGKSVIELSREILAHFGSLQGLAEASVAELCEIKGLGQTKAILLKAAVSLAHRISAKSDGAKPKITQPIHAYHLLKDELEYQKQEHFMVILLNTKGEVMQTEVVAIGTLSRALVHPRDVFQPAIRHKAASLLLVHNHPSGDPTPSKEDIAMTAKIRAAADLLSIPIQDHVIIGRQCYASLRELGHWN